MTPNWLWIRLSTSVDKGGPLKVVHAPRRRTTHPRIGEHPQVRPVGPWSIQGWSAQGGPSRPLVDHPDQTCWSEGYPLVQTARSNPLSLERGGVLEDPLSLWRPESVKAEGKPS